MLTKEYERGINSQYGRDSLSEQILSALRAAGKNLSELTRADLSVFDEFHIGGIRETRNLAQRIGGLKPGMRVLDVGSGLGGPARTLAAEFGCEVVGLDLAEEFVNVASILTSLVSLGDRVSFQMGNALNMPFEDGTFDVVWSQFAGMNIPDKARFYAECRRVVRDGGYLAFHEAMAGTVAGLHYPVFWADEPSLSHLRLPHEIREIIANSGFEEMAWVDVTQGASEFFVKMREARANGGSQPLGIHIFVGESAPLKAENLIRNLDEGRVVVAQAVYRARA